MRHSPSHAKGVFSEHPQPIAVYALSVAKARVCNSLYRVGTSAFCHTKFYAAG